MVVPVFLQRLRRRRRCRGPLPGLGAARRSLLRLVLWLAAISVAHVAAMSAFEGLSVGDALWLTATTMTTVGYGDLSAATAEGRWATALLLYGGGIFVLGKGAADYFEYRADRRALRERGRWRWRMKDHLVIANAPNGGAETYFRLLLTQLRETEWGRDRDIVLVSECWPQGLPAEIAALGVRHVHGLPYNEERLKDAAVDEAAAVVLLAADEKDPASDALAFDLLHRIRGIESSAFTAAPVLVECVDDRNRDRLRPWAQTVMRPMRGYPGMLVRALNAPGSEQILENLFTHRGDECLRYDVDIEDVQWREAVCSFMRAGFGTLLGYVPAGGEDVVVNAAPEQRVDADALFLLAKEGDEPGLGQVRELVASLERG